MKKAVFIIPYFGKIPSYFNLWMKTASINKEIDYWIYTDDFACQTISPNIFINHLSFKDFKVKVQDKFKFPIALHSPRKLCDFKPAYGYIFEEEIGVYSYWGYCDIDIIQGNLDRMIPWDKGYQKLFVHGHMTLFQNTPQINRLFMTKVDGYGTYEQIFSDPANKIFDESSDGLNINLIANQEGINTYIDYRIADINPYHYMFCRTLYDYSKPLKKGRAIAIEKVGKQLFLWEDGRLYRLFVVNGHLQQEEIRYFHFQKRQLNIIPGTLECGRFVIVPNKVFPIQEKITTDTLNELVRNIIIYTQYYRLKWSNLKKKIRKIL